MSTHVTTTNPVRTDVADVDRATADTRPPASRSWAFAGIGAGLCGIGTLVTSSMVNAIYDPAIQGDQAAIAARLGEQVAPMFAFHTFTVVGAVLMLVFAAGLHRRISDALPGSSLAMLAFSGLVGTAFVSVMGSGLDTEFMLGIPDGYILDAPAVMYNHWIGTIPWLWTLAGVTGLALFAAARRGGVPRWIGLVGLVLGGITLLAGASPFQYLAILPGALWLLATAIGVSLGDRAARG